MQSKINKSIREQSAVNHIKQLLELNGGSTYINKSLLNIAPSLTFLM